MFGSVFRLIRFILGIILIALSFSMIAPLVVLWVFERSDDFPAFAWAGLITLSAGLTLLIKARPGEIRLRTRDMYVLTTVSWLTVCAFAALPMVFISHISYTDGFFETMSGITTTGSTVLTGLDNASPGLLIWRSMLQWLGGIGFIGMAVAILPFLRVGGMRLFQTESSDWSEKATARTHVAAKYILVLYVLLTAISVAALWVAGMSFFDSLNHGMTLISTGGFSTSDASLANWTQPAIHWISVIIMILGALPFTLYVSLVRGEWKPLFRDQQVRGFVTFLIITWFLVGSWLWMDGNNGWWDSIRLVAVNITSVVTTTGVALGDYTTWGSFSIMLFFYLTFVGGCSGSTSGGLKIFRFQLAFALLRSSLKQLIHPRGIISKKYNGRSVDEEIVRSLLTFSFLFAFTIGFIAIILAAMGLDLITAVSASATAVCNVGPGLGSTIGPAGNFSSLPDMAKWVLTVGMLLGRLEILTALVLFTPVFWRY